jgi:hypothetical protein
MKDSTIIILVVAGVAVLFWAVSTGLLKTVGGPVTVPGTNILAPQPTQNYSGYLAASTAPGVSSALNGALSGLGTGLNHLFAGWFGSPTGSSAPTPIKQGSNPASPSLGAQPVGPSASTIAAQTAEGSFVGPQIPEIGYEVTSGSAFDYSGLAADNGYDPAYSLESA